MNPLPGHPDADIRPTLASRAFSDLKPSQIDIMNERSKPKPHEPNEVRFIKTPPRRTSRSNNLSKYGSWGYMMLGMLTVSVVLLMCGIWECIRRVQKSDVLEQFNAGTEPMDTISHNNLNDVNCPQYDPPPPYSSLFPLAKDFNSTTNSDNSGPPSIYFTASSATFLPTAPSPPTSLELQLPHGGRHRSENVDNDNNSSPA
jgi:hypothetical protein